MPVEKFVIFYNKYYRLMLTVAEQRLRGIGTAEDVVAEVFRIAWVHSQRGGDLVLPWLYQTLRNVIGNEYRRVAASAQLEESLMAVQITEVSLPSDDDTFEVRRALDALGADDRDLLYMAYWEDLSRQELARILQCSVVAVRVRLLRARQRLKAQLMQRGYAYREGSK